MNDRRKVSCPICSGTEFVFADMSGWLLCADEKCGGEIRAIRGRTGMNDAHDNAADDAAMWQRVQTNLAIEAFRKMELKRMQLEMAEYELTKLTNGKLDLDRYVEETEQVRRQMELRRADYERLGKLPKDTPAPMPSAPVVRQTRAAQPADTYTQRTGG
jgi:hypothetical protein